MPKNTRHEGSQVTQPRSGQVKSAATLSLERLRIQHLAIIMFVLLLSLEVRAQPADTSCRLRYNLARALNGEGRHSEALYYGKTFIETCADTTRSWAGFLQVSSATQFYSDRNERW